MLALRHEQLRLGAELSRAGAFVYHVVLEGDVVVVVAVPCLIGAGELEVSWSVADQRPWVGPQIGRYAIVAIVASIRQKLHTTSKASGPCIIISIHRLIGDWWLWHLQMRSMTPCRSMAWSRRWCRTQLKTRWMHPCRTPPVTQNIRYRVKYEWLHLKFIIISISIDAVITLIAVLYFSTHSACPTAASEVDFPPIGPRGLMPYSSTEL